jgi:hypothetical protein
MSDPIEQLQRASALASEDELEAFETALDAVPANLTAAQLQRLHLVLNDDTDDPSLMFEVVHRLEDAALRDQLDAFVTVAAQMVDFAPEWAQTLLARILNDDPSRAELRRILASAPTPSRDAFRTLLDGLALIPEPVAERAIGFRGEVFGA